MVKSKKVKIDQNFFCHIFTFITEEKITTFAVLEFLELEVISYLKKKNVISDFLLQTNIFLFFLGKLNTIRSNRFFEQLNT